MASDPLLWEIMAGLFVLTGFLHLYRARTRSDERTPARIGLAIAAFIWGATALIFRFYSPTGGYIAAMAAVAVMLISAVISARTPKQQ